MADITLFKMYKISLQTECLLNAERLHFSLDGRTLLQEVSLGLEQGSMTVLIGPNGAGKSTLMRLLSGYLAPTQGQVRLHGKPLAEMSPAELAHYRAVMRQHSQLNFPFTVEEVIRMGGYHRRPSEVEQHLQAVISATECATLRNKAYRQLSGGEQQRVQLARALLQLWGDDLHGKILFLDEPTSALDLHHQQLCLRLLKQLCCQNGLTVCCILHDLNLAALYADQLLLLAESRLQASGTPTEILCKPLIERWYQADIAVVSHKNATIPQIQLLQ